MKQIISALFLSIILHFFILYSYKITPSSSSSKKTEKKEKSKVLIRYVQLKKSEAKLIKSKKYIQKKETITRKKISKRIIRKEYKKVKKIVKTAKRKVHKKQEKTVQNKPLSKQEVLPNFLRLNPSQLQKDMLLDIKKEPLDLRMLDQITQSYIRLYGKDYNNFTKIQKVYLQNNLRNIGRITQRYLRYPSLSIKMRQSGMNIVEFILYPNGDISEPKIINSSKHLPLDKNTLETIYIAYKDYPRPKEATNIRIYVTYRLY